MTHLIRVLIVGLGLAWSLSSFAAEFEEAIPIVLRHEGKLHDSEHDAGGITHYGISLRFIKGLIENHPELLEEFDLNDNKIIDRYDIVHMTEHQATQVYRKHWWKPFNFSQINNQQIANKLFDVSVNMGSRKAIRIYQETYNNEFGTFNLKITGKLDKETLDWTNCLNESGVEILLKSYNRSLENYYRYLATRHPIYKIFLQGWLNRLKDD